MTSCLDTLLLSTPAVPLAKRLPGSAHTGCDPLPA